MVANRRFYPISYPLNLKPWDSDCFAPGCDAFRRFGLSKAQGRHRGEMSHVEIKIFCFAVTGLGPLGGRDTIAML